MIWSLLENILCNNINNYNYYIHMYSHFGNNINF